MKLGNVNIDDMENIVFSGGGIKALLSFTGTIQALEKIVIDNCQCSLDEKFHRYAGASMGAIFAFFLAMGATASQVLKLVVDEIHLDQLFKVLSVNRLLEEKGLFDGTLIRSWLEKFAHSCGVDPAITFGQLFEHRKKTLVIVITHLNADPAPRSIFASYENFPHLRVIDAVLMSSALPFFTIPFQCPQMHLGENALFIDGGLLCNFPFHVFQDGGFSTLGFLLEFDNYAKRKFDSMMVYARSVLEAPLFEMEKRYLEAIPENVKHHVFIVPHNDVDTLNFDLDKKAKEEIMDQVQKKMQFALEKRIVMAKFHMFMTLFFQAPTASIKKDTDDTIEKYPVKGIDWEKLDCPKTQMPLTPMVLETRDQECQTEVEIPFPEFTPL